MAIKFKYTKHISGRTLKIPIARFRGFYLAAIVICYCVLPACRIDAQQSPPKSEKFSTCSGVFAFQNIGGWREDVAVTIYDEDGQVWYMSEFNREGFDVLRDAGPNKISPLVLIYGDYVPVLRCVSYSRNWYAVIVVEDDQNPVIKYMLRNDSLFAWQSWDTYYLGKWIRFDQKGNPLRTNINSTEIIETPSQDTPTRATRISGDWIKLEWSTKTGEKQSGWIKWRDENNNRILVGFPYS